MTRVLITAGAAGLGRAMAEGCLARGDRVAVCDVDPSAVDAFRTDHPQALAEVVDVTDESAMTAFLGRVEETFGGVDVVCANAGTGGQAGRIETLDLDAWRACLDVNLTGAFLTCRWAARVMRAQGDGLIVLTSSTAGLHGYPLRAPYASAKWAIVGLTKTLAMELGPAGIRVNAICPGAVEGDRMDRVVAMESAASGLSPEEVRALYVRGVSLRSWVTAEDVAETVLWLSSPAARKISGQILAIDGHTETLSP
ncbi:NAD(P)-dependent dehydrogenase, short-chain alcohol dehydrogenase family [Mameliella alba]|uniref:SDR family oxidoreductase n=1 Tax=Mameliella alba TaxID=561184 RepID=UPI00088A9E4B|nr:SDR family oxidoreductase [Mameliella alba]OWV49968.1 NAD(P)-dependent oxidoreductase [Mameliella alba]PTR42660.1 NAD(P)-dependent dehydrogenase (short-subunit alcohol dehydrogenase family) [Mameliella alba]GGF72763.1 3-ketoacyl-ACP reductase [Mameliella alba]SDC19610.1 NAD(P)-dependent dehydrogenase, short-chain alcohol dehydrogenase family [Mameliella alba]